MTLNTSYYLVANGQKYELVNSLETRKQLCIRMGGLRPAMEAVAQFNEYAMAQVIAIAAGKKKVEPVFENVVQEGAAKVAERLGEWVATLITVDDEDDEGNEEAETDE